MRVIFSLIFFSLFLLSETINDQIHALDDATPKERVELMNHIKEQLISMNEEKRTQTLDALRAKLQAKNEKQNSEVHERNRENHSKNNKQHQKNLPYKIDERIMEHQEENFHHINEQHQYEQESHIEEEIDNHEVTEHG